MELSKRIDMKRFFEVAEQIARKKFAKNHGVTMEEAGVHIDEVSIDFCLDPFENVHVMPHEVEDEIIRELS